MGARVLHVNQEFSGFNESCHTSWAVVSHKGGSFPIKDMEINLGKAIRIHRISSEAAGYIPQVH